MSCDWLVFIPYNGCAIALSVTSCFLTSCQCAPSSVSCLCPAPLPRWSFPVSLSLLRWPIWSCTNWTSWTVWSVASCTSTRWWPATRPRATTLKTPQTLITASRSLTHWKTHTHCCWSTSGLGSASWQFTPRTTTNESQAPGKLSNRETFEV